MSNLLFLITVMGSCPGPKMADWTRLPWVSDDTKAYYKATEGCKEHFKAEAPCLAKFIKRKEGEYYAICGTRSPKVCSTAGHREYWFSIRAPKVLSE